MLNSRKYIVPAAAGLMLFLMASIGLSQSDKDLFKKAQSDMQTNQLESAREALQTIVKRANDKRKTPDKKYTELLDSANKKLAEREVAAGEAACARSDFSACRKQLAVAKSFDAGVAAQLQAKLDAALAKLKQDHQSILALADSGNPQLALTKLAELLKFEEFLPSLKTDMERVRGLYLLKLDGEGKSFIAKKQWNDAESRFKTILGIAADNASAKESLANIERGRKAYATFAQVDDQAKGGFYEEALEFISTAIAIYPESKQEFSQKQKQINQDWTASLLTNISELIQSGEADFPKSLEAYLRLHKVLELDPANNDGRKYMEDAKQSFAANATQLSQKLADISDLSKIATATVLKFDVFKMTPDLIPEEDLKDAMGKFNRKRVSQLVLSVENVGSGATPEFTRNVQARTTSIIDRQSLRDLRLRTKEDFEKDPKEDVQFQSLRPDGKSYTALMTVSVTKCDFKRNQQTLSMKSTRIDGTKQEPNPKWDEQSKRVDEVSKALNSRKKKDKPTPEGYTDLTLAEEKDKLSRIPQSLTADKIVEYPYQKIEYAQNTEIEVDIMIRDNGSRQEIDHETISYALPLKGFEISGIKDRDQNQLQDQKSHLPEKEEALEEGLRFVRERLDVVIPKLIRSYTDRFFAEGEKVHKAGNIEDAVEAYLCHWAFYNGKLDPPQMKKVARVVKQGTGFDVEKQGGALISELLKVLQ